MDSDKVISGTRLLAVFLAGVIVGAAPLVMLAGFASRPQQTNPPAAEPPAAPIIHAETVRIEQPQQHPAVRKFENAFHTRLAEVEDGQHDTPAHPES